MTLQEASQSFHIDMETLCFYERSNLLQGKKGKDGQNDYTVSELQHVLQFGGFLKMGMDPHTLKHFMELVESKTDTSMEQIRILRTYRYQLIEEIHDKQQALDQLDYLIHEIKCRNEKGG
ncbi:MAG TPA: MerR family transcriptional regulator [Candidatus Blautia stercoravium]|nr:MerR family transcriptional regulator [Candidatus Blautia stercoravium]